MICPNCGIATHESFSDWSNREIPDISGSYWSTRVMLCPECNRIIIQIKRRPNSSYKFTYITVQPKNTSRNPIPKEVEGEFANDYMDACKVLADSPKASAALSRRCLQSILREKGEIKQFNEETKKIETTKIKQGDLANEIQQILDNGNLPTQIANAIDAVRNIGNFAAHPIKSKNTGEIVDVEPGEAEWNLDVIESLFDYYFVQPSKLNKNLEELNQKLKESGKPPVKQIKK